MILRSRSSTKLIIEKKYEIKKCIKEEQWYFERGGEGQVKRNMCYIFLDTEKAPVFSIANSTESNMLPYARVQGSRFAIRRHIFIETWNRPKPEETDL